MNWQTIVVAAVVAAVFAAIIIAALRNKKKGRSTCSCVGGCAGCAHNEFCRH
ncbi:MAG: FeoB-associated Cys-rich membrane protein [Bacillota bacterium]|nr:FeoB-associated Cys-rich membrane protein [Bacillota bacterium]